MGYHPFHGELGKPLIFDITYKSGSLVYRMRVERLRANLETEDFMISSLNNTLSWVTVQNNRPYLRNKLKLKNKKIHWKVLKGEVKNQRALNDVIALIEERLEREI